MSEALTTLASPGPASDPDAGPPANLPVVVALIAFVFVLRASGAAFFLWSQPQPFMVRHCLLGLGLQAFALVLALRRRSDLAILVVGTDLVWIGLLTPRFGSGSMLFLFGLIPTFLVLVMTRIPVRLRVVLAVLPPATFAAIRFSTDMPPSTGLLPPQELRLLATANVLTFIVLSLTITFYSLRASERSRRRAEELAAARSRLIDDMSHELRTPLSIVLTAVQGALARERTGDAYRDSLRIVERQARRLGGIVHRMLEMGRAERAEVAVEEVDDLQESVRRIVEGYRDLAAEKSVELSLEADDVDERTDASVLHFVLGNLLSNAIRYSPEGGRIDVRLDAPASRPRLTVRDQGPGIAAEDLPHVFERYYRADKARSRKDGEEGFGLGLAIARRYARLLGATVEAESMPGQGATFIVSW